MGKTKSSAFWWFMYNMQEEEFKRTGRVPSMGQINKQAGERWSKMTAAQKQPFIEKDKEYKAGPRLPLYDFSPHMKGKSKRTKGMTPVIKEDPDAPPSRPESRSSLSSLNSTTVMEELSRKQKLLAALKDYIDKTDEAVLVKTKFYSIATNVMCATRKDATDDDCIAEDTYYPMEIGIAEFTIADGILYELNKFTDPGHIPENMARICHEHAKKHQIPLSDFSLAIGCCKDEINPEKYLTEKRRQEYDDLMCDLHDLLANSVIDSVKVDNEQPVKIVFSQTDQIFQNKGCLRTIGRIAGYDHFADDIEVFDVTELFFYLCRRKNFRIKAICQDILDCSKFDFNGLCEYHSTNDVIYCAITVAKKYCWLMFEKLCELYDIELTKKHKPEEIKASSIGHCDSWVSWDEDAPAKRTSRKRYFEEDFDSVRRPTKVQSNVAWPDSMGRGTSRFIATDIRERDKRFKTDTSTEPIAGPSGADYRPRLPGCEPTSSPFTSYSPRPVNGNGEAKPAPLMTLGRGRARNHQPEI